MENEERPGQVSGQVTGEVTGEVTGRVEPGDREVPGAGNRAQDGRRRDLTEQRDAEIAAGEAPDAGVPGVDAGEEVPAEGEPQAGEDDPAEEETPVAAVPPGVALEDIEPKEGFRLPEDQAEAEDARMRAAAEAQDASRPEVAQRAADEAKASAEEAADEAAAAQEEADRVAAEYDGPGRPPLDEGWRYRHPEPGPHDPA